MKKKYEKPGIHIESFLVSEQVALACGTIMNYGQDGNCSLIIDEDNQIPNVFSDGNCSVDVDNYGQFGGGSGNLWAS